MIIAVSGNVGSGKTTLAKYISEKYCFDYIPQHRLEFDFIDDFFNDIEGKFFPAQVSFLLSKAIELQELYSTQKNIVIDRSLLEDIDVFARLWIENRNIDPKIIQLYKHTAEFIKASVPPPDVYLICRCPAEVSISRIDQRKKRHFEDKYPPNHVQMLEQYYSMLCIEQNTPYVNIDTVYYDFKDKSDLEFVCNEIFSHLEYSQDYVQLSFLESTPNFPKPVVAGMDFHNFSHHSPIYYKHESKRSEYIYFAAPFTQVAEKGRKLNDFEKNIVEEIKKFAKEKQLKIISIGKKYDWTDKNIVSSLNSFITYYNSADYVITNTFHGNVFSILFNRQFVNIDFKKKKVDKLLEHYELSNRTYKKDESNIADIFNKNINYLEVNKLLEQDRIEANKVIDSFMDMNNKKI